MACRSVETFIRYERTTSESYTQAVRVVNMIRRRGCPSMTSKSESITILLIMMPLAKQF